MLLLVTVIGKLAAPAPGDQGDAWEMASVVEGGLMVKLSDVGGDVTPPPETVTVSENTPVAVGVPLMAPVLAL